jgi:DNA mismatch endonuclease (patch repair protein)
MTRDPAITSRIMRAIPNRNTKPELLLRRELHRRGLRYRLYRRMPGRPDLVFPGPRVAVFVDGDFWHGNTWKVRGADSFDAYFETRANGDFWRAKIRTNMARDETVNQALTADGWTVLRIWESELASNLHQVIARVEHAVHGAAETGPDA